MEAESIEKIIEFLEEQEFSCSFEKPSLENQYKFSRELSFIVEGREYFIEWWINQSYLKLESGFSKPRFPFRYLRVSTFAPTSKHKLLLEFSQTENFPFASFKIPFN